MRSCSVWLLLDPIRNFLLPDHPCPFWWSTQAESKMAPHWCALTYGPHLVMGDTHLFLATSYSRRAIISQVSAFHSASQATPVHLTLLRFFEHSSHLSTIYQKQQRILVKLFEWSSWHLSLWAWVKVQPPCFPWGEEILFKNPPNSC